MRLHLETQLTKAIITSCDENSSSSASASHQLLHSHSLILTFNQLGHHQHVHATTQVQPTAAAPALPVGRVHPGLPSSLSSGGQRPPGPVRPRLVQIRLGAGRLRRADLHQGTRRPMRGQAHALRHLRRGPDVLQLQPLLRMLSQDVRVL